MSNQNQQIKGHRQPPQESKDDFTQKLAKIRANERWAFAASRPKSSYVSICK